MQIKIRQNNNITKREYSADTATGIASGGISIISPQTRPTMCDGEGGGGVRD